MTRITTTPKPPYRTAEGRINGGTFWEVVDADGCTTAEILGATLEDGAALDQAWCERLAERLNARLV